MVYYLKDLLYFGVYQVLLEEEILERVEFALLHEWKKHLLVQGFDLSTRIIND